MPEGDYTRRRFFQLLGDPASRSRAVDPAPIRPPWARPPEAFAELCRGCGSCVAACPPGIIRPRADGSPEMAFDPEGCDFCGACVDVCPSGALDATARRAGASPWRLTATIGSDCLADRGVICRACSEACPSLAIRFPLRAGAVATPVLDLAACSGCGFCLAPCPAGALVLTDPSTATNPVPAATGS